MVDEVTHTDARELAEFEALPVAAKLREIWLNGRETNGKVAEAVRDIAEVQARQETHAARISRTEHWQIRAAAVGAAAIVLGPLVFTGLDLIIKLAT